MWALMLTGSVSKSHRISGKTPIEDIVETMKEFVLYVVHPYLTLPKLPPSIPTTTDTPHTICQLRPSPVPRH
jgi:hypothetical protein